MPTLSQSDRLSSSSWADAFPSRAGNLNDLFGKQSWQPNQYQSEVQLWSVDVPSWGQLEPDNTSSLSFWTFDFSSIAASPEAVRLRRNLYVHGQGLETLEAAQKRTSILDFPRLNLGAVLRPLGPDDDLLGEMLNEARS
jgi:hypothetical protein